MKPEGEEKVLASLMAWAIEHSERELVYLEVTFAATGWCVMGNQVMSSLPSALASLPCKLNLFGFVL